MVVLLLPIVLLLQLVLAVVGLVKVEAVVVLQPMVLATLATTLPLPTPLVWKPVNIHILHIQQLMLAAVAQILLVTNVVQPTAIQLTVFVKLVIKLQLARVRKDKLIVI